MANLFNVLDHEVSDDVIGKIGAYLNEPPARTKDGLAKAIPAILCALHQKTATTAGQSDVFGLLQRGGFDARPRDNLATIASSPGGLADLAKVGGPLLAMLFGARQSPLIDWLASAAGLSKSAATSLLALAVPMVLSVVGRLAASTGTFDVASVTRLIKDQGAALSNASPPGLAQALGVSHCGEAPVRVAPAAASRGPWWWLLPLLLLALLLFAWRSCQREPVREPVAPPATLAPPRPVVSLSAAPAAVKQGQCATLTWSSTNASNVSIEPAVGKVDPSVSKQVCPATITQYTITAAGAGGSQTASTTVTVTALAPRVKVFTEAALFDFDKAVLKPEGQEQIKAYREEAKDDLSRADKVTITGHTDNVGQHDYNATLSLQRAEAVRDYLIVLGADASKFQVIGAGETKPIADNTTDVGRAMNRRVEVEVIGVEKP